MNNFSVGYAEDLKNGCNSHGEAIILNPSRRDTDILHYTFSIIPIYATEGSDKSEFGRVVVTEWGMFNGGPLLRDPPSCWVILFGAQI